MNNRKKGSLPQLRVSRQVRAKTLRLWGVYLLALLAWVAVAIVLTLFFASLPWSLTPFYGALIWLRNYIVFVCIAFVLAGWAVISFFFLARPIGQLAALTQAAAQLATPTQEPITLPEGMEDTAAQLNLARERALRDAQAAREAEQRKNDLVVYLAHDLKTPLTSVIGYLTLLRDEPQITPELRARYTNIALDKAERLEDLINEFFDITRFNLTHLELEKQPVDLALMLRQVASEFEPQFGEKGLTCRLDLPDRLEYDCDPDKLSRVFDNLLRNAYHYSFPNTAVDISARQGEGEVILTFSNAGRTIPPEKLGRIFEQFFRLDSSRASRTGGAGLGLAIAQEIVALHGGTISAQSENNHITFTVRLPAPGTP